MKMDLFWHPDPILSLIVSFMPFCSIVKLIQTCKRFKVVCEQDILFVKKRKMVIENINNLTFGMFYAARKGYRDLVDFFIEKGVTRWDDGMHLAAEGGHQDLVDFFIEKGATGWEMGMYFAARGGHQDLVDFFIEKGAIRWNLGRLGAVSGGYPNLVDFFFKKGATYLNALN